MALQSENIIVTHGVTAAWCFATHHDDAPSDLQFEHGRSMVLVSAYAPTLLIADDDKDAFYDCLDSSIRSVSFRHRLFLLRDFSARVSSIIVAWPKVLRRRSVGCDNSNDTLLLETCAKHELVITNTLFTMAKKYDTTWQHPRKCRLTLACSGMFWTTSLPVSETCLRCTSREQCGTLGVRVTTDYCGPFCLCD